MKKLLQPFKVGEDVGLFLVNFERTCEKLSFAPETWPQRLLTLLPCEAAEVVARLSAGDADDYDKVKSSLLKRYRLSAEAFRQRFRNASKKSSEAYSEFAYGLKTNLIEWLKSEELYESRDKVVECVCLEQFFRSIPQSVKLWVQDRVGVDSVERAAELAKEYATRRKLSGEESEPGRSDQSKTFRQADLIANNIMTIQCRLCKQEAETIEHLVLRCPALTPKWELADTQADQASSHDSGRQFWSHLRRPFGIVVGMLSQFVMMPLIAFGLISAMRLNGLYAIGMLVIGCCPGGAVSNIFAYFCDGDVPLSIAMTLCSTVLAMGMMPLNMLLYGQYVDTGDIVIPYSRMATSLVVVSVPAGFGILFNWFFPKISPYITKASRLYWGSSLGGLLIVASQIMEVFIFPDLFSGIPPELYGATLLMPLTGMIAGYGASWVCRRPEAVRRTVAIESGIQNVGTALTIVSLSFQFEASIKYFTRRIRTLHVR
ncbi:hypothetical protein HPB47_026425 [Ixodes persulcatus]|uniref:Uncharacterized protein n=1 Tax=Ixodes persulcatus TaxID=34615 RepID=A0AC60Q0G5_IXOPE|nr:hypothetical protein HPB47_026425 [Ixodes persulcatus]